MWSCAAAGLGSCEPQWSQTTNCCLPISIKAQCRVAMKAESMSPLVRFQLLHPNTSQKHRGMQSAVPGGRGVEGRQCGKGRVGGLNKRGSSPSLPLYSQPPASCDWKGHDSYSASPMTASYQQQVQSARAVQWNARNCTDLGPKHRRSKTEKGGDRGADEALLQSTQAPSLHHPSPTPCLHAPAMSQFCFCGQLS